MVSEHHLSERRACRLVGLSRDSYRHPPQADQATRSLHEKIVEIAHVRRRFGYRRIHDLLRPQFPGVNHKRVYRLYRQANLAVRRRKKGKRPVNERVPLQLARTVNEVWSMDFVSDSLSGGRRLKYLTVADDFSHESVDIAVDFGISGQYVTRVLDRAALFRGYPQAVRTDNGPEFTSRAFMAWAQAHGIRHILIQPGRPMQNGYIESFNGKFRDEHLNEQLVRDPASGQDGRGGLANGLQRGQAAQQPGAHATGSLRRAASPARWRCSSIPINPNNHRVILNPDFHF
jgi:putative transposase